MDPLEISRFTAKKLHLMECSNTCGEASMTPEFTGCNYSLHDMIDHNLAKLLKEQTVQF